MTVMMAGVVTGALASSAPGGMAETAGTSGTARLRWNRTWCPPNAPTEHTWNLQPVRPGDFGMNACGAWQQKLTPPALGEGVKVAVIDSGYTDHEHLDPQLARDSGGDVQGRNFTRDLGPTAKPTVRASGPNNDAHDPGDWKDKDECGTNKPDKLKKSSWHGTHVAGIVARAAPAAKIMPVRVFHQCGGPVRWVDEAIRWAADNGAKVINLSLGGGLTPGCTAVYSAALDYAAGKGSLAVIAAGNDDKDVAAYGPASCGTAPRLVVAATGRNGGKAWYSNWAGYTDPKKDPDNVDSSTGTGGIDIAAPGGDDAVKKDMGIWSMLNLGDFEPTGSVYGFKQGTSMAAPHVAAAAALVLSVKPALLASHDQTSVQTLKKFLTDTAAPLPDKGKQEVNCWLNKYHRPRCGRGLLNADAAVTLARNSP